MRDKRLGKFTLYREEIENYPDNVRLVMKEVIVVRAEYMWDRECIEYTAISDQFSPIPPAEYPPEYRITIQDHRAVFIQRY